MDTPVLFLFFRRPQMAMRVFREIRKVQPKRLFLAADGPREAIGGESELCSSTRDQIESMIDWDCSVKRLYREKNLGCKNAVCSAIDWFFSQVEEGIILEDDTLPSPAFFGFCNQMLSLYAKEPKVMAISGTNILVEWKSCAEDYIYSYYGGNWGWATWRRAWLLNDIKMSSWKRGRGIKQITKTLQCRTQARGLKKWFNTIDEGADTWDFQWFYTRLFHEGLSIVPTKNLISNIGFGMDATHTLSQSKFANLPHFNIQLPAKNNLSIKAERNFDKKNAEEYGLIKNQSDTTESIFKKLIKYFTSVRL